jgi:thiazolinyl imide reductase
MQTAVLLCGANYGRSYLAALARPPKAYRLAGILARGSARSKALARRVEVPLYRDVSELPEGIDVACVALPGSASEIVFHLMKRNIHVLCEHPRRPAFLAAARKLAEARGVCFHLNAHFSDLSPAAAFIAESRRLCQTAVPCFLDVMTTDRALYGALDITRRALGTWRNWRDLPVRGKERGRLPLALIRGRLGDVPATFQVQTSWGRRALPDGSPEYLLDYRIALGFPGGILSLMSLAGPVIWNANYSRAADQAAPLWRAVCAQAALTGPQMERERARANRLALDSLVRQVRTGIEPPEQSPLHLRQVSRLWDHLGRRICQSDTRS